ncbi:MauE/DoxX family redox-associated membrane protein [Winogradskyella forsetii]|uniref:MauE/DoxX family redox-associated membrane protein n=1 Tax=Winogradskyella forsetii TaxID=2686077 RepID=UPI0015B7C2B6|nr:MauE/DoxX family redox-associated membrane protein [Winogradskyella forsetii]
MKRVKAKFQYVSMIIIYMIILLLAYAAVSKILDFKTFETQLGQSPLLGAFAIPVAYGIIIIEILTSLLLALEKTRIIGLYAAYILMVMFTAYIVIILNFTSFTPCSCGGVLEDLSWTEHFIFNCACIALALWGIFLSERISKTKLALRLLPMSLIAVCLMVGLYLLSDNKMKRNNAFQRKYIPHALLVEGNFTLESNSFYIAGIHEDIIYLGNHFAPLYLKAMNTQSKTTKDIKIEIENYQLPYKRVRIEVKPPHFFIGDGTVPVLFKGKITNFKASLFSKDKAYFYQYKIMDSTSLSILTTSTKTNTNTLGILKSKKDSLTLSLYPSILKQQINGTFDTDGLLLWDEQKQNIIYVYYYRNQYLVADKQLSKSTEGKTIDTISKAQIDVAYYPKKEEYKIGKSVIVNRFASIYGNNLYVNTDRLGKYEEEDILISASIIDQYDIRDNSYIQSFYFYHQPNEKLKEFKVDNDRIIGLVDNQLWIYKIKSKYLRK